MGSEPQNQPSGTPRYGSGAGPSFWIPLGLAIVLLLAYLILLYWLFSSAEDIKDENLWGRLIYVAGGLGALVSAATGWLFGREVHRGAAEVATAAAQSAREEAGRAHDQLGKSHDIALRAQKDAARGHTLAAAIRAAAKSSGVARDAGADVVGFAQSHLSSLQTLADELFPADQDSTEAGAANS
jgi:flagellar basal body-associated protein FliL